MKYTFVGHAQALSSAKGNRRIVYFSRRLSNSFITIIFATGLFMASFCVDLGIRNDVFAVGAFNNATIADFAINNYSLGSYGGLCRVFVNNVVRAATGINLSYGRENYFRAFEENGAIRILDATKLSRGDIVQYGQTENDPALHTFIIEGHISGNSYNVVDSNSHQYERVSRYARQVELSSSKRAYRLGTVLSTAVLSDGTFIRVGSSATVYVIAGGAPLRVTNWNQVGGPKSTRSISQPQFNTLRKYPKDGTFIKPGTSASVYVVAGGAPLPVSKWENVGGAKKYTTIDSWVLSNQLRSYPGDGSYIKDAVGSGVYVVAGGAPLPVSKWENVGGAKLYTSVDISAAKEALRRFPVNGTVVKPATSNTVSIIAGGMAMNVSSWANIGGSRPSVSIDSWAIDNYLLKMPVEGTFIRGHNSGRVYKIEGQKPTYLSNASQVIGAPTIVDDWSLRNQLSLSW